MALTDIHRCIEGNFAAHLETVCQFLRCPSISADGTGIAETAEEVKGFIEAAGGRAEVVPTKGHPVVYGELMVGKPKTLLIYSMYDVMPVEGEEWIVPPFGGEIAELRGLGPCIVSRGVYNTKGPLRSFFNALSATQEVEGLPVNLKFVVEGEEELGSKHLPDFIADHKDWLASDAVFFPWFSLDRSGRPITYLGAKGFIQAELVCRGGEWGGPRTRGIHSRHGAWIASPVWKLTRALASLVADDESVMVDGFYDDVKAPSTEDEQLLERLGDTFSEALALEECDAARFKRAGLHGAALLREYLFSPVINIDGLRAGHAGAGVKTVIGHEATAKVDIRLVPDMTVNETLDRVRRYLDKHGFGDVTLAFVGGYGWGRTSEKEEVVQALHRSYRSHGYVAEIWPYIAGAVPFCMFTDTLGMPMVMGGLCHGGGAHGPNEYAVVKDIELFEKSIATFLFQYASS